VYQVEGLPSDLGLTVTQRYTFAALRGNDRCEPTGTVPCARFWPTVEWRATGVHGLSITVETVQRLDVKPDDLGVGLPALLRDRFNKDRLFRHFPIESLDLSREREEPALVKGRRPSLGKPRTVDNFHFGGRGHVGLPGNMGSPGCPECFHFHWAWTHLVNLKGRGFTKRPGILTGSPQTDTIAIVADRFSEADPVEHGYGDLVNREPLASRHSVMYWTSSSRGIEQADGSFMDATFPHLTNRSQGGDQGSSWFSPAREKIASCMFDATPEWDDVQHFAVQREGQLPAGWVLPVRVAARCAKGKDASMPRGPYYVMVTKGTVGNPDDNFLLAPGGYPYVEVRHYAGGVGSGKFRLGDPTTGPLVRGQDLVFLVFASKPQAKDLRLRVLSAP
jgi:hypothetical protein